MRNGGRKYFTGTQKVRKILLKCARGDRTNKLVEERTGQPSKKRHRTQKIGCRVTATIAAVNKDDEESEWSITHGKTTKHNHLSVESIGLPFYRRQQRGGRFRDFLRTCRKTGISPAHTRALAKEEFIVKEGLSGIAAAPVLRDIYNEFARIRYKLIISKTPVDQMIATLEDEEFFYAYRHDDGRLQCVFFAHLELIQIYKDNAKVLIYDCTYCVVKSDLPLLYLDFVTRIGSVLPLAHMLMEDETYESYVWAFQQLKRLFEEYEIDDYDVLIHDRDRAAMNALQAVFPGMQTMLCTWHMDTAVKAYAAKTFGWQKNKETNRFVPSELANEFLALYRKCRYAESELLFDEACAALDERAKCGEIQQDESDEYDPT